MFREIGRHFFILFFFFANFFSRYGLFFSFSAPSLFSICFDLVKISFAKVMRTHKTYVFMYAWKNDEPQGSLIGGWAHVSLFVAKPSCFSNCRRTWRRWSPNSSLWMPRRRRCWRPPAPLPPQGESGNAKVIWAVGKVWPQNVLCAPSIPSEKLLVLMNSVPWNIALGLLSLFSSWFPGSMPLSPPTPRKTSSSCSEVNISMAKK